MKESPILGKKVFNDCYWHHSLTLEQPSFVQENIVLVEKLANIQAGVQYNVIKYSMDSNRISLLYYPDFFDMSFPELAYSWRVDALAKRIDKRNYQNSLNPPILHRKELFISSEHPRQVEYKSLTQSAEQLGLFNNKSNIGYKLAWEHLISSIGYKLAGHQLVPLGNEQEVEINNLNESILDDFDTFHVDRHKTALSRNNLSAPIQFLSRHNFLNGEYSVFDYGCGKGDDLRNLQKNDINACGWDPHYEPENPKLSSDLVNLGFVLNVIEDIDERNEALIGAFELTKKLLVVSVMLYNQNSYKGHCYNDGVITSRNTFQKYFTQTEIKEYINSALNVDSIPIAPGILFVFSDKNFEQKFLQNRQSSRSNYLRLVNRPPKIKVSIRAEKRRKQYELAIEKIKPIQLQWLSLGRKPDKSEIENIVDVTRIFGTYNKAMRFLIDNTNEGLLEQAYQNRLDDLLTYLAVQTFSKRTPFSHMEPILKRDIKHFFGDYKRAVQSASELIYQLGNSELIKEACERATEEGIGYLDFEGSLHLPAQLVERLPAILRLYVACASVLYGEVENADLVKIHRKSGKLSLMMYDDFEGSPLPLLMQRVKINFRTQEFDIFDYGDEFEPTYLYLKSQNINEEFPHFAEQLAFDEKLQSLKLFDFYRYGPPPSIFRHKLAEERLAIEGFELVPSQSLVDLDELCGLNFTYRQFIECGETWEKTKIENIPKQADTYTALHTLAKQVLDPVIDYFGMIELTYGFSSAKLAKAIPGSIAPKIDQHSSYETNRLKNPICPRLGAACDFIVKDENMLEVAQWLVENTLFDRLYFYGNEKPIHVSIGPDEKGEIVLMRPGKVRLIPSVIKKIKFLKL